MIAETTKCIGNRIKEFSIFSKRSRNHPEMAEQRQQNNQRDNQHHDFANVAVNLQRIANQLRNVDEDQNADCPDEKCDH